MKTAEHADIPALVKMAERLHDMHEGRFSFRPDDMAAWFAGMIGNPAACVACTDGGFIAGLIAPAPQNREWLVAYEAYWWASDKSGLKLARAFEQWAREHGAQEIKFSHPTGARAGAVLERLGHEPAEIVYTKR